MYSLKRIFAYVIDYALLMFITTVCMQSAIAFLEETVAKSIPVGFLLTYASLFITFGMPVLILGTMVGTVGWTPGKFVLALRVEDRRGKPIGIGNGLLREIVKVVSFSFFFGVIWALYGIITSESSFYDDWLGCSVDDKRPSNLTETQKNWRKQMRS